MATKPRDFQDILSRLPGARQSRYGWTAPCPLPGHNTPARHLTLRDVGGRALITCQGGRHGYHELCAWLGFDSLTYATNGACHVPVAREGISDAEAMTLLKATYGLTDATIEHFGIRPEHAKQAWVYPVQGGGRFKKYDRQPPKYWHTQGTPNQLYGLTNVPDGTATIWLATGEPCVWVLWQAGIPAVCGIYGEGKLPDNTIEALRDKGVRIVDYAPDLDMPGRKAAVVVHHALKDAFEVRLRQLPGGLGDRADVADLFVKGCDGGIYAFTSALDGLPLIDVQCVEGVAPDRPAVANDASSLICLADVEAEDVSWLWYPYIPLGKLTLLDGDPGVGKSWVSLALATAVSLGTGLPGTEAREPQAVLLASAEDGVGDTLRPRLDAMGAAVGRIHAVKGTLEFADGGLVILEQHIESVGPLLVVIDPLVAYIGADVDIHRANETRSIMARLADIAGTHNCAILAVRHLTKGGALKPIYRGLGSIDFTAACRSVLLAGCDPDDERRRALAHIKSNLAPKGSAIGYELREGGFYWTGESDLTAERMLSVVGGGEARTARDEAADFLRDELSRGPVDATEVWRAAKEAGLSEATIKRAKGKVGVITRRRGETGKRGAGKFTWELPGDLGDQGGLLEKGDPVNDSSFENAATACRRDPLNTSEDVLEV